MAPRPCKVAMPHTALGLMPLQQHPPETSPYMKVMNAASMGRNRAWMETRPPALIGHLPNRHVFFTVHTH